MKDEINLYKHIRHLMHTYIKNITSLTTIHNVSQTDKIYTLFHRQAVHKKMYKNGGGLSSGVFISIVR